MTPKKGSLPQNMFTKPMTEKAMPNNTPVVVAMTCLSNPITAMSLQDRQTQKQHRYAFAIEMRISDLTQNPGNWIRRTSALGKLALLNAWELLAHSSLTVNDQYERGRSTYCCFLSLPAASGY